MLAQSLRWTSSAAPRERRGQGRRSRPARWRETHAADVARRRMLPDDDRLPGGRFRGERSSGLRQDPQMPHSACERGGSPDAHAVTRSARLLVTRRDPSAISRPRPRIRTRRGPRAPARLPRGRSRRSPARRWRWAPQGRHLSMDGHRPALDAHDRRGVRQAGGLAHGGAGESERDGQGADAHREHEPGRGRVWIATSSESPFVSVSARYEQDSKPG